MNDDNLKHSHSDNDIIIRDHDGTYKILRDGKFVSLDKVETAEHVAEHGPKRAPEQKDKIAPTFKAPRPKPQKPASPVKPAKPKEPSLNNDQLLRQANQVVAKSGVMFASGELRIRAVRALMAHKKGIRKPFETKDALTKPQERGGVGLSLQEAERLLAALKGKEFSQPIKKEKIKPVKKPDTLPVGKEVTRPTKIAAKKLPPVPPTISTPPKIQATVAPRPAIVDIKKPSQPIVGLATELAYRLADWRRLAENPQDRIKKIENQLGVLEEDRYPERIKGLVAWHNSEVMKLYLEAAQKSLEQQKPLKEILAKGGANNLSYDEWQAVSDLNERIGV